MVIPEFIRLLDEKEIEFDEAVEIVTKVCSYTNHTILAEALEKWPKHYLEAVLPQLVTAIFGAKAAPAYIIAKDIIHALSSEAMINCGSQERLNRFQNELINKEWFQTLPDFNAYVVRKEQAIADYTLNPLEWTKRSLINISKAGFFSSDRIIMEYNKDIWRLGE